MADIKDKVEAVLFAVGRKIDIEEITKITKIAEKAQIEEALQQLKQDYDSRQGPIALTQQGTVWKMGVADSHIPTVQNIISETELDRQTMETLAVIAYKAPVLQSDVIKIRTNKAYDHLKLLEELGYIAREVKGRTKLITLSQYFFKYFDVPSDSMKQMFNTVQEGEKLVERKEQELKEIKEKVKELEELKNQKKDEEKKEEITHEQELAVVDDNLLNEGVIQKTAEDEKKEPYEIEIEEMEKLQKEKKKLKKEKEKRKKEREAKKAEEQVYTNIPPQAGVMPEELLQSEDGEEDSDEDSDGEEGWEEEKQQ